MGKNCLPTSAAGSHTQIVKNARSATVGAFSAPDNRIAPSLCHLVPSHFVSAAVAYRLRYQEASLTSRPGSGLMTFESLGLSSQAGVGQVLH